ncbi:unnamed protein product [Allacma fusca]|uniref:Secreted protein n=1 Tax=Allacma fusca TaxID=39272 RepID=A0A8J2LJC6_9HEXA|nr:unnamed protein product [Allacma fusca]
MTRSYKIWIIAAIAAMIATCTAFPQEGNKELELTVRSEDQPATAPSLPRICSTIVGAFPNTTPALMRTSDSTDSPDNQTTTGK